MHSVELPPQDITGIILAGGRGRRVQHADKGLLEFEGRPVIEHVITALRPQVGPILISANRNLGDYARYGYPVIADRDAGYAGPLAGIASCMAAATTPYVLAVPCDAPRLPVTLASGLFRALAAHAAGISVVHDGTRIQPLCVLMQRTLLPDLLAWLDRGGRRAEAWATQGSAALADFSGLPGAFLNLNTPEDFGSTESDSGWRTVHHG